MLRLLLALTLLCTCAPALLAQFTLAVEGGIAYAVHNRKVDIPRTAEPAPEERLRAVGGDAPALHLGFAPADKKISYGLRVQYLKRGYQHIYTERSPGLVLERDVITSEVGFIDVLPAVNYGVGGSLLFGGGPYLSMAVTEKNAPVALPDGQSLHRQDYGLHLNGRFKFGRFYFWSQYQLSLQKFDAAAFNAAYPSVQPIEDAGRVSLLLFGIGFQLIR